MCIAICKLRGNELPSKEKLQNCFRANPDGCGIAFSHKGVVHTYKGFFNFDKFYNKLMECDKRYKLKEQGVLLHFRISTHGLTNAANCHPFALTSNEHKLTANFTKSKFSVIHNGICSCTSSAAKTEKLSDTARFVRDYLSKIATFDNWFDNPHTIDLIEQLIESKMAILNGKGDIIRTEGFHKADDGNFYSNNSYMPSYYGLYDYNFYDVWYEDDIEPEYIQLECPLMQLKYDETVIYDDGRTEGYESGYHNLYPIYLTKEGDLFANYNYIVYSNKIPMEDLTYLGHGHIIKENSLKRSEFRKDAIGYV